MDNDTKESSPEHTGQAGGAPESPSDMIEPQVYVSTTPEEFEQQVKVEMHKRGHDPSHHVDLSQEEYTPQEVARLIGTSLDVVMHAIWQGELKAERQGRDVICIDHNDVTDWLRRRGGV